MVVSVADRERFARHVETGAAAAVGAVRFQVAAALTGSGQGGWVAGELFDRDWWDDAVDRFVVSRLEDVAAEAVRLAGVELGLEDVAAGDGWEDAVAETIAGQRLVLSSHGEMIEGRVGVLVERANTEGWSADELAEALGVATELGGLVAAAGPVSDGLAAGIGLTESHTLVEFAPLVLWLEAGLEGWKTWVCTFDGSRRTHIEAHLQTVGVREPFVVGDSVIGQYPGDWSLPGSERVHCRCFMVLSSSGPGEGVVGG